MLEKLNTDPAEGVGARFREFRNARGLSQRAFAELIGSSYGYISQVESGRSKPGFEILCSLKQAFPEADLEYLIMGRTTTRLILTGAHVRELEQEVSHLRAQVQILQDTLARGFAHAKAGEGFTQTAKND